MTQESDKELKIVATENRVSERQLNLLPVGDTLERLYRMSMHDIEKYCDEHDLDFHTAKYLTVTVRVEGEIFTNG